MPINNDGIMIILSSPSGAGKTTLVSLLSKLDNFEVSISHTTRQPRPNEVPDKDYYFINDEEFKRLIGNSEFLEYAKVFNNLYGTTRTPVIDKLNKGKDVLFDIDWQGYQQLKQSGLDVVGIFILPPSKKELIKRLKNRGRDTKEEMKKRMNLVQDEISHFPEYDYVVINKNINLCVNQIQNIVNAERLKKSKLNNLTKFVNKFRN